MKKPTDRDILLDAGLDFIMNSPADEFDAYLRESGVDPIELERKTTTAIDLALNQSNSMSNANSTAGDPFASLTVAQLRDIASSLQIPRNVLTAFRERRVVLASVPRRFLVRLAKSMNLMAEQLITVLSLPSKIFAREYKADSRLENGSQVSFEQLLIDADVDTATRIELLKEAD
ncbi:hypothetical protein [Nitrosospira sp. NRS527]|uniref:hypothetical protein n=1 Tax=Nitrosospira sp. NRS527 TaxID=155925 RepID=UPI001AFC0CBF|nr:hypothetical protein [Nitrosospira sp. NRS527]BCT69158.1 hypothetical protein NNRS527_02772 [Nitrosospira sp. NRS527]